MKLYRILADYRPIGAFKPHYYYVYGRNKSEARKRFSAVISWLKVYGVELYEGEPLDPMKNIII